MAKPRILGSIFTGGLIGGLLITIGLGAIFYPKYQGYQRVADAFDLQEIDAIPAMSEVVDFNGDPYSRLTGDVRYVVPLAKISPDFINALIAREDSRFRDHHGVDFPGIARAAVRNFQAGSVKEGASTLTQQLARNTFDLGEDRWRKKIVEALLAIRIEKKLSKDQILEAYANRIYFGVGMYGVETASRACFGKTAAGLTLSEAAILAGLIRSPNRLTPLADTSAALTQRDQVLRRMEQLKMITPSETEAARDEPMPASKRIPPQMVENYAMDAVIRDLTILVPKGVLERGGLKIYTTIDRRLQMIAEDSISQKLTALEATKGWSHPAFGASQLIEGEESLPSLPQKDDGTAATESAYIQGALVAIDNETGGLRAIVGGRDFKASPFNRAVLAKRQLGSTFKPFVYAAAFARGMAPGTLIDDGPIVEGDIAGLATTWSPENSDSDNRGMQPAALGLIQSRNTMTVRVGEIASRAAVRSFAVNAGLESVPDMPAIYLGAFEVTLKNLTAAYTMFSNQGVRKQPYIIEKIEDRHGKIIYRATRAELSCLSPAVAYVMNELLSDVIRKGTGAAAAGLGLTIPAAGKTGTTDDYKDAWFVGYTSSLTCGVWVGMDRPQRIMDRGYGSKLALPIWVDFMQNASAWKYTAENFAVPEKLPTIELCRVSGALAVDGCRTAGMAYSAQLPAAMTPAQFCPDHGGGSIGPATGMLASVTAPPAALAAVPVVDSAPIAPSIDESIQPVGAEYRVIRKANGFIFQYPR